MSKQVPAQPYTGPFSADVTHLNGKLVDLPPGGTQLLRAEREGIAEVSTELANVDPSLVVAAGVPQEAMQHFTARTSLLEDIRAQRAVVDKIAEVLRETEAKVEHERENDISMIAESVKTMARLKGDPSLLATYEKTLKYASQSAQKAVKTRRKNTEGKRGEQPGTPS